MRRSRKPFGVSASRGFESLSPRQGLWRNGQRKGLIIPGLQVRVLLGPPITWRHRLSARIGAFQALETGSTPVAATIIIGLWRSLRSAPASGAGGRGFESRQPDHEAFSRQRKPAIQSRHHGLDRLCHRWYDVSRNAGVAKRYGNGFPSHDARVRIPSPAP